MRSAMGVTKENFLMVLTGPGRTRQDFPVWQGALLPITGVDCGRKYRIFFLRKLQKEEVAFPGEETVHNSGAR